MPPGFQDFFNRRRRDLDPDRLHPRAVLRQPPHQRVHVAHRAPQARAWPWSRRAPHDRLRRAAQAAVPRTAMARRGPSRPPRSATRRTAPSARPSSSCSAPWASSSSSPAPTSPTSSWPAPRRRMREMAVRTAFGATRAAASSGSCSSRASSSRSWAGCWDRRWPGPACAPWWRSSRANMPRVGRDRHRPRGPGVHTARLARDRGSCSALSPPSSVAARTCRTT